MCLTTLLIKVFSFNDFLGGQGRGRDGTGRTDKQTDIWTDRLFSENIILDGWDFLLPVAVVHCPMRLEGLVLEWHDTEFDLAKLQHNVGGLRFPREAWPLVVFFEPPIH